MSPCKSPRTQSTAATEAASARLPSTVASRVRERGSGKRAGACDQPLTRCSPEEGIALGGGLDRLGGGSVGTSERMGIGGSLDGSSDGSGGMTTTAGAPEGVDVVSARAGTELEAAAGGMLPKGTLGGSSGMRTASPTIVVLPTGCTMGAEEGGGSVA